MTPHNSKPDKIAVLISEDLKSLIPEYLADRQQDLQRMCGFFSASDLTAIQEVAHMIKGSGASYGFEELTVLGDALETAAANRQPERVQPILDRLADYLDRVEVVYV